MRNSGNQREELARAEAQWLTVRLGDTEAKNFLGKEFVQFYG